MTPLDDYVPYLLERIAFALFFIIWGVVCLLGVIFLMERLDYFIQHLKRRKRK